MSYRVAVVAPGGGYGADGPLLMFSAVAARRRGAGDYEAAVVFGKSLGSLAAPVVAERGLAAVWFTPFLDEVAWPVS